jgi:hypothetical protein
MALSKEADEQEQLIDMLESRLDRLRSLYEMYFQGIEKLEPSMERTAVKNAIQNLRKTRIQNTALRFRLTQLVARLNSYETYWTRISRKMEDGTYHRDIFKARYRSKVRDEMSKEAEDAPAGKEQAPQTTARAAPASAPKSLNDQQVGAIYDAYVMAKRRCKESTKGLTRDALATSLRKQVPAVMKQYKCKSVEFKVVIKKGKAVLKIVPKF